MILSGVAPFFLIIAAGVVAAGFRLVDDTVVRGINGFIFFVGLPALVFDLVARLDLSTLEPRFAVGYPLAALATYTVMFAVARYGVRTTAPNAAGLALTSSISNSAFLAFPVIVAVYGAPAAPIGATFLLIENIIILPVAIAGLSAAQGGRGVWASVRKGATAALRNPVVLAGLLGGLAALSGGAPPAPIGPAIERLAAAASPVALFSLGVFLKLQPAARDARALRPAFGAVVGKLVVMPIMMAAAGLAFRWDEVTFAVAMVLALTPTAVGAYVQCERYGVFVAPSAAAVAGTTLVSVLTLAAAITYFTP